MKLNRLFSLLQLVFVVTLTVYIAAMFAPLGIDPHHDGIMMKPAVDVLHGKTLFKETFTQYGALSTIIQSLALRFFGEQLLVIKYLTVAFYGGIAALLWLLWAQFLPPVLSTLITLVWIGLFGFYKNDLYIFLPWSSVYALFTQMVALHFLVMWAKWKHSWMMFLVGVFASLTFWFRQPVGVFVFGSILLFWIIAWIKKIKLPSILPLVFGFTFIHLIFFYWLIKNDSLVHWWDQSIGFAASWARVMSLQYRFPIHQISKLLPLSYSAVSIWVLFPAAMLYQGYRILKIKKGTIINLQLLAVVFIGLASWPQYYPLDDPRHCFWAATPMMGMFVYSAWNNSYKDRKRIFVFLLFLLLLVPDIFNGLRNASNKLEVPYYTFTENTILKGMKENKNNYDYFQSLIHTVGREEQKNPNTFVLSATADALYGLFGKNTINCSRYYVDWRWDLFDKRIGEVYTKETRNCIQKYKPLILTDATHYNPAGYKRITAIPSFSCTENTPLNYLLAPIE